jgi:hypothetical protein
MIGDAHRVPVESLDRAGMENPRSGLVSSISCTSLNDVHALTKERCETSFGDYTPTDRVGQEWLTHGTFADDAAVRNQPIGHEDSARGSG